MDILEGKDVGDGIRMEPHFPIISEKSLLVGGQEASIAFDSHCVFDFPGVGDKTFVAEQINCQLVVEQDQLAQVQFLVFGSCAECVLMELRF